jgi:hypothetical protein
MYGTNVISNYTFMAMCLKRNKMNFYVKEVENMISSGEIK